MRIVYYKLPTDMGEDVMVMEQPFYEAQVALLFTAQDATLPLFTVDVDGDDVTIERAEEGLEPAFLMMADGFVGVLPARNEAEARELVRRIRDRIITLEEHNERIYADTFR